MSREKPRHPWCAQSGKYSYGSRKRALGALNTARARPKDLKLPVAVYRCPHCREWHLTSVPPRPR